MSFCRGSMRNLEAINPEDIDQALDQWRDEDDGADDYPSFGEIVAVRFGVPKRLAGFADKQLLAELERRGLAKSRRKRQANEKSSRI